MATFKIFWLALHASFIGESRALIVQIDPSAYEMVLSDTFTTMENHLKHNNGMAAINAGMFWFGPDEPTTRLVGGLWKNGVQQYPPLKSNMKYSLLHGDTIAVAMPGEYLPEKHDYTQAYRMVYNKQAVWQKDEKFWSAAVLGWDGKYIYLIHVRSPYAMNDLAHQLIDKLGLSRLAYLEGGPESTLTTKDSVSIGSYETDFWEDDSNREQWEVPFAFVVVPKY